MTGPSLVIIESRPTRQAMPILAYVAALIMACLYISDVAAARALAGAADTVGATIWQYTLLVGAALALSGVAMPRRSIATALMLEAVGAAMISAQTAVYLATVATGSTNVPWATVVWIGLVVSGGLAYRAVEAFRDRGRRLLVAAAVERAVE